MNILESQTSVVVRIIGENIDFNNILNKLPAGAKIHRKGDVLFKKFIVENDVIIFDFKTNKTELIEQLTEILDIFESYKRYLKQLSNTMDIIIRIYMQSNMAQLYSYIPNDILMKISDLSMSIEFSVWSEGMVKDTDK